MVDYQSAVFAQIRGRSVELLGIVVPCAELEEPRRPRRLYLALRPLVEGLGLSWKHQFLKVKASPNFADEIRDVRMTARDGKPRMMVALPDRFVFRWLGGLDPGNLAEPHLRRLCPFQKLLAKPEEANAERVVLAARMFFFDDEFSLAPPTAAERESVSPYLGTDMPSAAEERANGILQTFLTYHRWLGELRKELAGTPPHRATA